MVAAIQAAMEMTVPPTLPRQPSDSFSIKEVHYTLGLYKGSEYRFYKLPWHLSIKKPTHNDSMLEYNPLIINSKGRLDNLGKFTSGKLNISLAFTL